MRTTRSSSRPGGLHQAPPGTRHPQGKGIPLGAGTSPGRSPQLPPWLWAWTRSPINFLLGCGPGPDPSQLPPLAVGLDQIPLNFPLGCGPVPDPPQLPPWLWAWTRSPSTPPLAVGLDQIPLNSPLGCGPGPDPLHFPLGFGPGDPPRPAARHAGIPPAMRAGIAPPPPWTDTHL